MIKSLIQQWFGKPGGKKPTRFGKRRVIAASTHGIDPQWVDERAWTVVRTLQERGYTAYIVGGAVRDLLLGLQPKDRSEEHTSELQSPCNPRMPSSA